MNLRLLIASLLAVFTTGIHIFLGGTMIVAPMLESAIAAEARLTLLVVWHVSTLTLGASALVLFIGSLPRYAQSTRPLVIFVSVLWLGFAAIFVVVALSQPECGWLFRLPQWTVLTPVGLLGLWGASAMRRP